jgi:DnaD/phage-associated family protein
MPILSIKTKEPYTVISNNFIDNHMRDANPTFSVVYIYMIRLSQNNEDVTAETIADALNLLESDVIKALKYWEKAGVLKTSQGDLSRCEKAMVELTNSPDSSTATPLAEIPPAPVLNEAACESVASESAAGKSVPGGILSGESVAGKSVPGESVPGESVLGEPVSGKSVLGEPVSGEYVSDLRIQTRPEYSVYEIELYKKESAEVRRLVKAGEQYLGKLLHFNDLKILFSFYDWLRLPIEVIETLLEHCVSNGHKSLLYIEKAALDWSDRGVNTVEKAKEYLETNALYRKILKAYGITGRLAAPEEIRFFNKWLAMFTGTPEINSPEARDLIFYAIELTMLNTQGKGAVYSYTDKIISEWRLMNIKTLEQAKNAKHEKFEHKETKKSKAQNKIVNYTGRTWDYDKLDKLAAQRLGGDR